MFGLGQTGHVNKYSNKVYHGMFGGRVGGDKDRARTRTARSRGKRTTATHRFNRFKMPRTGGAVLDPIFGAIDAGEKVFKKAKEFAADVTEGAAAGAAAGGEPGAIAGATIGAATGIDDLIGPDDHAQDLSSKMTDLEDNLKRKRDDNDFTSQEGRNPKSGHRAKRPTSAFVPAHKKFTRSGVIGPVHNMYVRKPKPGYVVPAGVPLTKSYVRPAHKKYAKAKRSFKGHPKRKKFVRQRKRDPRRRLAADHLQKPKVHWNFHPIPHMQSARHMKRIAYSDLYKHSAQYLRPTRASDVMMHRATRQP
jgi:hypothetical protein